jgi:Ca2+-binding RTX toxin-like protein
MRIAKCALLPMALGSILFTAPPARAQQMISNFGFDTGILTWDACCGGTGTVQWDGTLDATGSARSGSARLVHNDVFDGTETALFVTRCLGGPNLTAGKKLFFGMKARFAEGESTVGRTYLALEFRPEAGCTGNSIAGTATSALTSDHPRGAWFAVKRNPAAAVTVPAGTKSLKVFAVVTKDSAGTLTANLDDLYVASTDTPVCDGLPATIVGDGTSELINGTEESDVIVARGGNDSVDAKGGNDRICGGPGNDILYGGEGDDRIFGEGGQDELWGGPGNDLLYGAGNNDTLHGGDDDDKLRGGTGVDTCYGDGGANVKKKCELPFVVPF